MGELLGVEFQPLPDLSSAVDTNFRVYTKVNNYGLPKGDPLWPAARGRPSRRASRLTIPTRRLAASWPGSMP